MSDRDVSRLADLSRLLRTFDVDVVQLTECLVSPGWRLAFRAGDLPGMHYNLAGNGKMVVADAAPIELVPHTLIITPPRKPFHIEVANSGATSAPRKVVAESWRSDQRFASVQRVVAGDGEPEIQLVCGYFRATFGISINLFGAQPYPIVHQFEAGDGLVPKLKAALNELSAQQLGMEAMTTALIKQVLVTLFRRRVSAIETGLENVDLLEDTQIAHAFADMVARPGAAHSLLTLARTAGLSRSVFMARFSRALGQPPMAALRQLRMRYAADLLRANALSIEEVARASGYASRSSFFRAFREVHGTDPSDYRAASRHADDA